MVYFDRITTQLDYYKCYNYTSKASCSLNVTVLGFELKMAGQLNEFVRLVDPGLKQCLHIPLNPLEKVLYKEPNKRIHAWFV